MNRIVNCNDHGNDNNINDDDFAHEDAYINDDDDGYFRVPPTFFDELK